MTRVNSLKDIQRVYGDIVLQEKNSNLKAYKKAGKLKFDHNKDQRKRPLMAGKDISGDLEGKKDFNKDLNKNKTCCVDGFNEIKLDPKKVSEDDDKFYQVRKFSSAAESISAKIQKSGKRTINNGMSKTKKSIFDKLYEEVMDGNDTELEFGAPSDEQDNDLDQLGVGDDEGLGDEGETVTITLTKDQADCLKAICDQLAGDEDFSDDDMGGDEDFDLEGEDDNFGEDEGGFGEGIEAKTLPSSAGGHSKAPSHSNAGNKSSMKVGDKTSSETSSGEGKGAYTDKQGTEHPAKEQLGKSKHAAQKNNKVQSSKTNGANKEFFGK